ncbi:MAG: penicillin-insensitive murein endopeptidase [Acidobacteria bacterium]|nr:penicillin-insensitive murein endopeptidase [Acidobacteriota bacterium]
MKRKPGPLLLLLWSTFLFFAWGLAKDDHPAVPDREDYDNGDIIEDDVPENEEKATGLPNPYDIDLTGQDLTELPCLSCGSPNRGRLINGIKMQSEQGIRVRNEDRTWGTPETIAAIRFAVAKVHQEFPGTPDILVGDISRENGGRLGTHKSHQSGRDVDLSYYPSDGSDRQFFFNANEKNMDVPRTWKLIEGLMADDKTQYIFIDRSVQKVLYKYVRDELQLPEDELQSIFGAVSRSKSAKIRHARGHKNHIHVRFTSPEAVMAAMQGNFDFRGHKHYPTRINASFDMRLSQAQPAPHMVSEDTPAGAVEKVQRIRWAKVRKGDNLWLIARRNDTTVEKLCKLNGISKKARLQPGKSLKVKVYTEYVSTGNTSKVASKKSGKSDKTGKGSRADARRASDRLARSGAPHLPAGGDPAGPDSESSAYYVVRGQRLYSITPLFGMRVSDDCRWLLFSNTLN